MELIYIFPNIPSVPKMVLGEVMGSVLSPMIANSDIRWNEVEMEIVSFGCHNYSSLFTF